MLQGKNRLVALQDKENPDLVVFHSTWMFEPWKDSELDGKLYDISGVISHGVDKTRMEVRVEKGKAWFWEELETDIVDLIIKSAPPSIHDIEYFSIATPGRIVPGEGCVYNR